MAKDKKDVVGDGWDFNDTDKAEANWFKFDKVGARISGEVVDISEKEGQGTLPAQRVFVLRLNDGDIVNVGISMNKDYVIQRTNRVRPGDRLGFEYNKDIPAKTKGYAPAKSIEVYWRANENPSPSTETEDGNAF